MKLLQVQKLRSNNEPAIAGSIFDNKVLTAYLECREHEIYYRSLFNVQPKRDFALKFRSVVDTFLKCIEQEVSYDLLDKYVFALRAGGEPSNNDQSNLVKTLARLHPEGFKLLELPNPINFDSLKSAYKAAALRHHPDRGGRTVDMQAINAAYLQFHKVLSNWELYKNQPNEEAELPTSFGQFGWEAKSTKEYEFFLTALVCGSLTDIWAIDEAIPYAACLRSKNPITPSLELSIFLLPTVLQLAQRLAIAGMKQEAEDQLEFAQQLSSQIPSDYYYFHEHPIAETKEILRTGSIPRIVITHGLQAENLKRLKVIDEKRFLGAMKRFGKKAEDKKTKNTELSHTLQKSDFLRLPYDQRASAVNSTKKLVPHPDFDSDRIVHLTPEQREEYFLAFSKNTNIDLITKYFRIRLSSYMCSAVYAPESTDLRAIKAEIVFLQDRLRGSWWQVNEVIRFVDFVETLPMPSRLKAMQKLKSLDTEEKQQISVTITISLDGLSNDGPNHLRIEPGTYYVDSAIEKCGGGEIADSRRNDLKLIREISEGKVARKARDILWKKRVKNEELINALLAYIEQLLEAGKRLSPVNTGLLDLGYWINALSTNYAKEKKWKECQHLIELFFGLERHYHDRLSNSDRERLIKRLERSRLNVSKIDK